MMTQYFTIFAWLLPLMQQNSTNPIIYIVVLLIAFAMFGLGLWLRPKIDSVIAQERKIITDKNLPVESPKVASAAPPRPIKATPPPPVPMKIRPQPAAFEAQYRQQLISQVENFPYWAKAKQNYVLLSREDFYVMPHFHVGDDRHKRLRLNQLLKNFAHVALLGSSGCGKTETINYLLLTQARHQAETRLGIWDDLIPILISAPKLAVAISTLSDLHLATFVQQQLQVASLNEVEMLLKEGRFFLFVDNLNELFIHDAERVIAWLEPQIAHYPDNRLVVVARPALQESLTKNAALTIVHFADMDTDSLEQFAQKWQDIIPNGKNNLANILREDTLFSLVSTPFHLLMMLMIANRVKSLPTRRLHLYPLYLNAVLSFENEEEAHFSENEKRTLLQTLAFTMHQRHQIYMDRNNLSKVLRGVLHTPEDRADFFIELCLDSGILIQHDDRCRFSQLTLQEFLVAREIVESNLYRILVKQTQDLWWHEVITFVDELNDTKPVINRVFTQETGDLIAIDHERAKALTLVDQAISPIEPNPLAIQFETATLIVKDLVEGTGGEAEVSPATEPAKIMAETSSDITETEAVPLATAEVIPTEAAPNVVVEDKSQILVVDDTPQNLKFARFILERGNYDVAEANTALEAIEWLKDNKPTLILSDIQMPGMNGFEFCQYLKENQETRTIPFIFVTAFSRASKEIVKGLQLGADDYVPRPFAPEELLARIGANVRIHKAEESARRQAEILARRNRELALLNQIQRAVTASLNLDNVLETTLEQVQMVLKAEATSLWFIDHENQALILAATFKPATPIEEFANKMEHPRILLQDGLYAEIVRSGQPFISADITAEAISDPLPEAEITRSLLCVPLKIRAQVIGLLQAVHQTIQFFNQEDLNLLIAVADAVTVAIENAWLFGQLQRFNQQLDEKVKARTRELVSEKEKTDTILISIVDGLLVIDPDKRIVRANPAMEKLLNITLLEMVGTSIEHPQFNSPLWDFIRRIIRQPGDIFTDAIDISHSKNPNKILSFQANAAKMWEETQGGYLGTVIALRDVTALQEVDRMKASFMTGITHELKTPLAIITLQLGGLMKYYDRLEEAKKLDMIRTVDNATRLLSRLVDSILELSRLDSGMLKFNFTPTNLVELSRQVVQELQPLAEQKSLGLTFNSAENVVLIDADPHQLDRAVRSLAENAIKYTPEGKIEVTVTKNDQQAIVNITDTGIGLTEEQMERLFERFYRADNQRNILGTGLGLSITQEIVRHHQGEVTVSSVYGQGSTFKVFIPLKK